MCCLAACMASASLPQALYYLTSALLPLRPLTSTPDLHPCTSTPHLHPLTSPMTSTSPPTPDLHP